MKFYFERVSLLYLLDKKEIFKLQVLNEKPETRNKKRLSDF